MQLRYIGFDQAKNVREYRFESVAEGETQHFLVSVDLALFVKHNVGLQEGPALCLKRLSADLDTLQQLPHELTSDDLAVLTCRLELSLRSEGVACGSRGNCGISQNIDTPLRE
jgi:hypothetical protein